MGTHGPARATAVGFGITYLGAFLLLSELLGSLADPTAAFTEHFDDSATRVLDIIGGVLLLAASVLLLGCGLVARYHTAAQGLKVDLMAGLAVVAASGFFVSAGLLLSPPITQSVGELTGDPGIGSEAAAGIAQAGTVLLLFSLMLVGGWTVLVAQITCGAGSAGRTLLITGYVVAALAFLGVTVVAALPLGLWWLAFGFWWRPAVRPEVSAAGPLRPVS